MVDPRVLLQLLEKTQAEFASEALKHPNGREAFDYGRLVGVMAGLTLAKEQIEALLADREDRDNKL